MLSPASRSRVAVLAFPHISPFHLSVPTLVFGGAGLDGVSGLYDVEVCAEQPGSMPTAAGYGIRVEAGLEAMDEADLVVIPSWRHGSEPSTEPSTAAPSRCAATTEPSASPGPWPTSTAHPPPPATTSEPPSSSDGEQHDAPPRHRNPRNTPRNHRERTISDSRRNTCRGNVSSTTAYPGG